MSEVKKAVVLLSGGLDSATTLAVAIREGFEACALSFDYGQRHGVELKAAGIVAGQLGAKEHLVMSIDLTVIGGSALTGDIEVPKGHSPEEIGRGVPATYVPARNTVFLGVALGLAEVRGARDIFIGVNARDYSGYPDCRPEYIEAFERLANLATRSGVEAGGIRIHAPLMELSKSEIIRLGTGLGVDFSITHSCYDPSVGGTACGYCDSCILRRKGFLEAGMEDPVRYNCSSE